MIKAVFFDVGSTLIDPNPDIDGVFYETACARGHKVEKEFVTENLPAVIEFYEAEYLRDGDFWCSPEGSTEIYLEMYRYLAHLVGLDHDAESIAHQVHLAYRQAAYWKMFDDVLPCLKQLKARHLRLGVVSNWDPHLEGLLRNLQLKPYFEEVVSSADVGYRKPDPMIFTLILERMGLKAGEVIHVGDRPDADGVGAFAAGIKPIIIDRHKRHFHGEFTRVDSLLDLAAALDSERGF